MKKGRWNMAEQTMRELVKKTLSLEKTGHIPVILTAAAFAAAQSQCTAEEYANNPKVYVKANIETRRKFGYDANITQVFQGVVEEMGKGLIDRSGKVSVNGERTVLTEKDIDKLHPYNINECESLQKIIQQVKLFRQSDPDYPIMVIADNPSMSAAALMDGANFYLSLIKNKNFIHRVTELLIDPIAESIERIVAAGCDIIWLPMPTLGGPCMSKKHYVEMCLPYNKRFIQRLKKTGASIILHTCGNWNDRFDVATEEGADGLHVSEADLGYLKKEYGSKVALMGQVPAAFTMLMKTAEEVYQEGLEQCLTAAENGGFILSADCGLPGNVPPENIHALIRAARDAEKILGGNC